MPVARELDPARAGDQLGERDGAVTAGHDVVGAVQDERRDGYHREDVADVDVDVHRREGTRHSRSCRIALELPEALDIGFVSARARTPT